MQRFEGQTVAITPSERPLYRALADGFTSEGATVVQADADQPMDVLVILPPLIAPQPTLELSDEECAIAIEGGLSRSFQLMRQIGTGMVARGHGCILVIGGLNSSLGWPGYAVSSAIHGALLALTRTLAVEWGAHNVRVEYLSCGAVEGETPVEFGSRTPLGQGATPEQIAQVALYLASASFTTGTEFRADGGWSAWGLLK
jgi:NAD(P)-dependent dehydrogenase (short-subunit alcohol dehydrogenase family)